MTNKNRLAREWLYLVSGAIIGLLLLPVFLFLACNLVGMETDTLGKFLSGFFESLTHHNRDSALTWIIATGPYLLFQLIRSVIWAWKNRPLNS